MMSNTCWQKADYNSQRDVLTRLQNSLTDTYITHAGWQLTSLFFWETGVHIRPVMGPGEWVVKVRVGNSNTDLPDAAGTSMDTLMMGVLGLK